MISTQRYFIHIDNKSIVPWTSEIESNYKFKEITLKVALAIERGKISADDVIAQIMQQVQFSPITLDQLLDAKTRMNVREGELNLESQVKADNSQKDTGEAKPYEIDFGDGGKKSSDKSDKSRKPPKPTKEGIEESIDHKADEIKKVEDALGDAQIKPNGVNV